jgi:NAD(P)-dependent dehydrogenase (short-subunit alcohol dehydrogenase family)
VERPAWQDRGKLTALSTRTPPSDPAPITLDGQVAVVTGAGHGLGRAYASALGARGAAVVCNDVDGDAAAATAAEIVQGGGTAQAEERSVATPEGGKAIVDRAVETYGSIDAVINNAGQLRNAAFEDLTVDDFRQVIDTHLAGAFYVTQPAYRHMKTAGYGRIVFTSSSAGMFGSPWQANYGAAKAGVVGLCNAVALEGEPFGIKANAIMPMALTDIGDRGRPDYAPEHLQAIVEALTPLAPHMTVDNVAPLVTYLASARCAYTRHIFSVGCGHVARVFIGASRGWFAPGLGNMTPEQVETHLGAAVDIADFAVPECMNDESRYIAEQLPRAVARP